MELLLPAASLGLFVAGWMSWTIRANSANSWRVGSLVVEAVDHVTDKSIPRLLTNTNRARSATSTRYEVDVRFQDESGEEEQVRLGDVVLWRTGEERKALAAVIWAGAYAVFDGPEDRKGLELWKVTPNIEDPEQEKGPTGESGLEDAVSSISITPGAGKIMPAAFRYRAGPPRTSRRIVSGSIMVALLKAERLGFEQLATPVLGVDTVSGLEGSQASRALGEGIRRAAPALRSLGRVYVDGRGFESNDFKKGLGMVGLSSVLRALVRTPIGDGDLVEELEEKRGRAFYPAPISGETVPLQKAQEESYRPLPPRLNPLVRLDAGWPTSTLPVVAFFLLVVVSHTRLAHEEPSRIRGGTGVLLGLIAGVSFLALHELLLARLWSWTSGSWIASEAGLSLIAAGAGALVGWGTSRARDRWAPRTIADPRRDEMLQMAFHREVPVGTIEQDALEFRPLVETLRRFLDNAGTEPPVVLSVNGRWGSGKSSLMQMIRSELEKTGRFASVWFNAWRYQEEEQVMAAFLHAMARQLSRHWGFVPGVRLAWIRFRQLGALKMAAVLLPLAILVTALTVSSVRERAQEAGLSELAPDLVGILAGLGGLGWVIHLARPFAIRFRSLYQTKNHAERVGFLDEFTEEFGLYRQAVGEKKLLVIVDDLDRCDPEHVVAVLKAVNLIVTSAEGAGKTFFLLGFDPRYIIRAVELHYKEQSEEDRDFASKYLKKMVTLTVSVPRASSEAIAGLLTRLDETKPAAANRGGTPLERLWGWSRSLPSWGLRLLLACAVSGLVVWTLVEALPPGQVEGELALEARQEDPAVYGANSEIKGELLTDKVEPPGAGAVSWWIWTAVAVVILAVGAGLGFQLRPTTVELRYRREEQDSRRFIDALKEARHLLPDNPRDAVRLVNLMRLTYLVQCAEVGRKPLGDLPGRELKEEETVALAALHNFDPDRFIKLAQAIMKGGADESMAKGGEGDSGVTREDFVKFHYDFSQAAGSELEAEKLERYLEIHNYLLDVSRIDKRKVAA